MLYSIMISNVQLVWNDTSIITDISDKCISNVWRFSIKIMNFNFNLMITDGYVTQT